MVILEVLTITCVSVAMALSLAHALEFPGKMRLSKDTYYAVQPIYYPGFTIGGAVGELGGIVLTTILVLFTPFDTTAFWLRLIALAGLILMHAVYWLFTHPVNKFWLGNETLNRISSTFFFAGKGKSSDKIAWTDLRNRWEYSHAARAVLSFVSFLALLIAQSAL
jgi:hypothetical protein